MANKSIKEVLKNFDGSKNMKSFIADNIKLTDTSGVVVDKLLKELERRDITVRTTLNKQTLQNEEYTKYRKMCKRNEADYKNRANINEAEIRSLKERNGKLSTTIEVAKSDYKALERSKRSLVVSNNVLTKNLEDCAADKKDSIADLNATLGKVRKAYTELSTFWAVKLFAKKVIVDLDE